MIQIVFEFETQYGRYGDALYLLEGHSFTEEQIEAMKQERVDNWLQVVDSPPEVVDPAPEE